MDLTNLRQNHMKPISYMKALGYSKCYIRSIKIEIEHILLHEEDNTWDSYLDIYLEYEGASESSLIRKATVIGIIANFDMRDLFPNGRRRHNLWERTAYAKLFPEFKGLVDFYAASPDSLKLQETTMKNNLSQISNCLLSLQDMGCSCLADITEKHMLKYFSGDGNGPVKSAGHKNENRKILCICAGFSDVCIKIASYCPPIHNKRKNVQYITNEEIENLKSCAEKYLFSKRDRAILYLLLYTGLQSCDIANLTFRSLDWKSDQICILQQKTSVSLELPLSPIVDNAIFDYITQERPDSGDVHVFLCKTYPHSPLAPKGMGSVITCIMKKAGIRQNPSDRKGTHIFRHHAVTSILGKGVPLPVISKAMGHTAPDSLEPYFHADFIHLKECSISIKEYPISEEVFAI